MSLIGHAKAEFHAAGWTDEAGNFYDEMQGLVCSQVLEMLEIFSGHGHSGTTAPYAIKLFSRLANFQPIAPLTGEPCEWVKHDHGSHVTYQNKRASHVFKDGEDGAAHDINGKVFWEWYGTKDDQRKSYYTCHESRMAVKFPYVIPEQPIYEYRYSDAEPPAPAQTEEGIT
jgi:hypothetical protein